MDFEWVAIALNDVTWIFLAFILGFLARLISLPPLVGFLATGLKLNLKVLKQSGATAVFNIYTEAGVGFADHVAVNS